MLNIFIEKERCYKDIFQKFYLKTVNQTYKLYFCAMVDKQKILIKASLVSVIGNFILSALKIAVGIVAGSLAVLGDGIDSATDRKSVV